MPESLEQLRQAARTAEHPADRIIASLGTLYHPDATWEDVLAAFGEQNHEVVRIHVIGHMYRVLDVPSSKTDTPIKDPKEWERIIRS